MAKSAKGGGGSSKIGSLFAGVMLGMILGLAAAGGIAWYILKKNPASFEDKERHEAPKLETKIESIPPVAKVAPVSAPVVASAVSEQPKQHFEFYKVLTDKQEGMSQRAQEKLVTKEAHSPVPTTPTKTVQSAAASAELYFVQAGSFPSKEDAEKLKAKLALLGMEAGVQTADIPNKGTFHRVRLGPFKGSEEANNVLALLKQNGVANAAAIKAQ